MMIAHVPVKVDVDDLYNPLNFSEGVNFATQYGNSQIFMVVRNGNSISNYLTSAYLEDL